MLSQQKTIREVSRNYLFSLTSEDQHEHIRNLWADDETDWIVVFAGKSLTDKRVVSVGRGKDFAKLDDLLNLDFDGLRPVACARGKNNPEPQASRSDYGRGPIRFSFNNDMKASPMEEQYEGYTAGSATATLDHDSEREAYLSESEERLSERAQQIIQREQELCQWHENLEARERMLNEREKQLAMAAQGTRNTSATQNQRRLPVLAGIAQVVQGSWIRSRV